MPAKVAAELLDGVGTIALLLISKTSKFERFMKLLEPLGIGRDEVNAAMKLAAQLSGEQLRKLNADAAARRDYLAAVMTRFQLDLEDGEEARVLLRSKK